MICNDTFANDFCAHLQTVCYSQKKLVILCDNYQKIIKFASCDSVWYSSRCSHYYRFVFYHLSSKKTEFLVSLEKSDITTAKLPGKKAEVNGSAGCTGYTSFETEWMPRQLWRIIETVLRTNVLCRSWGVMEIWFSQKYNKLINFSIDFGKKLFPEP